MCKQSIHCFCVCILDGLIGTNPEGGCAEITYISWYVNVIIGQSPFCNKLTDQDAHGSIANLFFSKHNRRSCGARESVQWSHGCRQRKHTHSYIQTVYSWTDICKPYRKWWMYNIYAYELVSCFLSAHLIMTW